MKSYSVSFEWDPRKDTVCGEHFHDSYLQQLRLQTTEPIIKALQKKGYPADAYHFHIRTCFDFCGERYPLFQLIGTVYDPTFPENTRFIGSVRVFYSETSEAFLHPDSDRSYISPLTDITDRAPRMTCKFDLMDTIAQLRAKMEVGGERFARHMQKAIDIPVELRCGWPDVLWDFHFLDQPDGAAVSNVLNDFARAYNKRHREEPIHFIGEPQKRGNRIRIHVDFGGGDPMILVTVLKAIRKAQLPLEKLVLR